MHIIWALINTAFAILFFALVLTLFAKGKRLFNNKYGNPIIVVLFLGVMSFMNGKDKEFKNQQSHNGKEIKTNTSRSHHEYLEQNISLTFHLDVRFKKNEAGKFIPSYSKSSLSGFTSGLQWECKYVDIDSLQDGSFSFIVSGVVHWNLFGIGMYTQPKDFEGKFILQEY